MGWDTINVALMPYGEVWRRHRKVCHQNFNIQAARQYELVQTKKVRELLRNLLYTPEQFDNHNKLYNTAFALHYQSTYQIMLPLGSRYPSQYLRCTDTTWNLLKTRALGYQMKRFCLDLHFWYLVVVLSM